MRRIFSMRACLIVVVALIATSSSGYAQTPARYTDDAVARGDSPEQQKGYAIAARADRTDFGFGDSVVGATMTLKNAVGQQSVRQLSFRTLEKENETVGDKSVVVFRSPNDVKGTALLSHAKILEQDDQWLFLPALKRVKRISSANKSGPFVGSEFAFEDFTLTELNKFTYEYIGEDVVEGMSVDVVDRFPRYERSGYTQQRIYVDQQVFQPRKLEFFDRRGARLKTLVLSDYREYEGVWRAHKLEMTNHQSGKSTVLSYESFSFKTGLDDADFTKGVLQRLR